jgi:hypothetical protein
MRSITIAGVERLVGACRIPSVQDVEDFLSRGFFHDAMGTLPPVPATLDLFSAALDALGTMLGNGPDPDLPPGQDPVGDCVIAEDLHLSAMSACNAGAPWVPTTAQALALYSVLTGFVQGDPSTDQGTDPLALIRYRLAGNPYPDGSTLLDARMVDASSEQRLKEAMWLADGCFAWASLPDGWETLEEGDDVWDDAGPPVPANGHAFGLGQYGTERIQLVEWAMPSKTSKPIRMTYRAAARYLVPSAGGGVVAMVRSNAFDRITGKCPAGFDLSTVKRYVDSLGSAIAAG